MKSVIFAILLISTVSAQETTTEDVPPTEEPWCWEEARGANIFTSGKKSITCTLCSFIFQGLDDILIENEVSIAEALADLCKSIPIQSIADVCYDLLSKCTDEVIESIIENGLNPDDICGGLGLCP